MAAIAVADWGLGSSTGPYLDRTVAVTAGWGRSIIATSRNASCFDMTYFVFLGPVFILTKMWDDLSVFFIIKC